MDLRVVTQCSIMDGYLHAEEFAAYIKHQQTSQQISKCHYVWIGVWL